MQLGLGLGLTLARRRSGAFTPASLSPSAWFTAGPSWCFTDAGATVPCGDTDPVYTWVDRSGNARNLSQATLASRPTLRLVSGKWYVRTDGIDDQMRTSAFAYAQPNTFFSVFSTSASTFAYHWSSLADFGCALYRGGGASANNQMFADTSGPVTNFYALNAIQQFTHEYNTTSSKVFRNGTQEGLTTTVGTQSGSGLVIGNRYDSTLPAATDFAELFIVPSLLSTVNRQLGENYLKTQWGTP